MPKRPTISEDLHDHIKRIHEEYTGSSASSFEEALMTVTQLAETGITGRNHIEEDWYPGKYVGMIVDHLTNRSQEMFTDSSPSTQSTSLAVPGPSTKNSPGRYPENWNLPALPEQTAFFKTRLNDDRQVEIPEPEATAAGLEEGEIIQVVAYSTSDEQME